MAEYESEAAAEEAIIGAVIGAPAQNIGAPDAQDLDEQTPEPEIDAPDEVDEQKAEADDKTEAKTEEPAEDFVELPPEKEGDEPVKIAVADLVAAHKELAQFKGREAEVIERVEREATERTTHQLREVEQFSQRAAYSIHAALQLLQAPKAPDADALLNPQSQQYDPDAYHRAFAQYQRASQQHQQALQLGEHLLTQARQSADAARVERETAELKKLERAWPEFSKADTLEKFVSDMGREYGLSRDELDALMTDHRAALVARDALAFRAMKASGKEVKAKVEAKAPKLVRTKQEAKGASPQARNQKGQYVSDALSDLRKTNSDEAATRYFAGLVKAGRI